ncbi:aspartic peptidase domain-containing protein [Ilyonectria sp. MPI-CAGE-AT-0026]|nr:aspartic peptidase domain-containing protein [Ilyonectria sp. MPI-CAGE-AT-0026]
MLWLFLLIPARAASICDAEPLVLAIQDVQVLPNVQDSYMKGIAAQIGSPAQDIVLLPWAELNNTWNDQICEVRRGNLFHEDESTTFDKANDIIAAGGAGDEVGFEGSETGIKKLIATSLGGTDTLTLNGSVTLDDFPIGIPRMKWDAGYTMLHPLGLGSNSTYLNALRAAGKIGSRVWSLFWGRMWVENTINGSLILGGYDEEKVIGANYTAPLDYDDFTGTQGCWTGMKVILSDIKLNFRDGSDESIFPSNAALPCCLVPHRQLLLEVPLDYVDKFDEVTGINHTDVSYGLHWSARLFDADNVFDGDITFYLDSGLEIRVPNNQYIVPFVDIHRNGSRVFKNKVRELLINGVASQPATLGRYFFTSAYLMVNHDANTFTLWQGNPSKKSSLVRVFDEETAERCSDATAVVQPSATQTTVEEESKSTVSTTETDKAEPSSSTSGAVIGGAVAASIVGVCLIGLGVFYYIRRRRPAEVLSTPVQPEHKPPAYYFHSLQEMPGSMPGPSEMQGEPHFVYEMDGNLHSSHQGR